MDNVAFPAAAGLRCLPEFLEIAGGRQIRGIREKTGGSRLVEELLKGWLDGLQAEAATIGARTGDTRPSDSVRPVVFLAGIPGAAV